MKNFLEQRSTEKFIKVNNLIFDFFGTLVYYSPELFESATPATLGFLERNEFKIDKASFEQVWEQCFAEKERQARQTQKEYHMCDVGRLFFKSVYSFIPRNDIVESFVDIFIQEWNRGTKYLDGIYDFIDELSNRFKLSIISNTHYPLLIHKNLAAMKIEKHFAQVVTSVEFGLRKPNPKIFEYALNKLGIDSSQAIFVGDSYQDDFIGAQNVNLPCFLIDPKQRFSNELHRLDHLFDLKSILL